MKEEDRYGPQHEFISRMINQCDRLTDDELAAMAAALVERGYMKDDAAWRAVEKAGPVRTKQASQSAWDLDISLKSNGFNRDPETIRYCGWAVSDAGLAVSTHDLLGTAGYFIWDYDKLMYPWRTGAGDPGVGQV